MSHPSALHRLSPRPSPAGLLLVLLCLWCAGCVHYRSPAQRDATFSPYREAKIGTEPLRTYLLARSAMLFGADHLDVTHLQTNTCSLANGNAWRGTATAIDRRGYFLTAAHCVDRGRYWVAFLRAGNLQVEPARIVWRGDVKKHEPDLAVLCISSPLNHVFEWAAEVTNGAPILDVGLSFIEKKRLLETQCLAGQVLKISDAGAPPGYRNLAHDSPLHHGDSGGPLVLADGRLLGINVRGEIGLRWRRLQLEPFYFVAQRPNLAWLRELIDHDAARHGALAPPNHSGISAAPSAPPPDANQVDGDLAK